MVVILAMDNGKRLEMVSFHTEGHLTKIQRHMCRNKPISRRMLGQLCPWMAFSH